MWATSWMGAFRDENQPLDSTETVVNWRQIRDEYVWHLGIKTCACGKPFWSPGPCSPCCSISESSGHLLTPLLCSSSGPRPLSWPNHTHKAAHCSQWSFWCRGLFILISAASLALQNRHQLQSFILHWGQPVHDLQLLSLPPNLCSSSLSPPSIKSSGNLSGQIETKLLPREPQHAPVWKRRLSARRRLQLFELHLHE